MKCYCILKSDHQCNEILDSYEKQYEDNINKFVLDPKKVLIDPMQTKFRADINGVKLLLPFLFKLDEEDVVHFSTVVSHFPQEFTNEEKEVIYNATLSMIQKSKKYFVKDGRLTF